MIRTDTELLNALEQRHWVCAYAPSGDWAVFVNPNGSSRTHGGGMIYGRTMREAINNAIESEDTGKVVSVEQLPKPTA